MAVRVLLLSPWRSVRHSIDMPLGLSLTLHTNTYVLNNVTGNILFSTASPYAFTAVTCVHGEAALICDEQDASGGPASSGVLWLMPYGLRAFYGPVQHSQGTCLSPRIFGIIFIH